MPRAVGIGALPGAPGDIRVTMTAVNEPGRAGRRGGSGRRPAVSRAARGLCRRSVVPGGSARRGGLMWLRQGLGGRSPRHGRQVGGVLWGSRRAGTGGGFSVVLGAQRFWG